MWLRVLWKVSQVSGNQFRLLKDHCSVQTEDDAELDMVSLFQVGIFLGFSKRPIDAEINC